MYDRMYARACGRLLACLHMRACERSARAGGPANERIEARSSPGLGPQLGQLPGKIEVPVGSSIGTQDRRAYAAGPDEGPREHRARMLLHVTEWVEEKLQIQKGGWRVMQPGREEAITDSLKGMRVEGKGVGRTAVRVALVELAAAQRLKVQAVIIFS